MGNVTSNPQVIPPRTQVFSFYHFCCWCAHCYTFVSTKQPRMVSPPKHTDVPHQSHKDNLSCSLEPKPTRETCKSHFSLFSILSDCNTVRAEETLNPADWIRPRSKPRQQSRCLSSLLCQRVVNRPPEQADALLRLHKHVVLVVPREAFTHFITACRPRLQAWLRHTDVPVFIMQVSRIAGTMKSLLIILYSLCSLLIRGVVRNFFFFDRCNEKPVKQTFL